MSKPVSFVGFLAIWNHDQGLPLPDLHRTIAEWLEGHWRAGNRELLLLVFRDAGKSTLVGLFCAWLLANDPDLRILVLAADLELAGKMVRNVKRVIERHSACRDLLPQDRDQWAADRFTVRRVREHRDPSMLARSVATNITGSRADVIICDDVEVPRTCDSAAKREDLRRRLTEIEFVLVPGGTRLYVGTPHAWHSIYADRPRPETGEEAAFLDGYERLELALRDEAGRSRWPERFTPERIDAIERRTGPLRFASQMMLRPVDVTESRLDPARLRVYDGGFDYREANGQAVLSIAGRRMVSASCWWDPAYGSPDGGDASVVAALFCDGEGGYWLHRVAYLTHDPNRRDEEDEASQLCRQVAAFAGDLRLPAVQVEINGLGRYLPGILRQALRRAALSCAVVEVTSRRPKALRILEAFDAVLAAGALNVHRSVLDTPFVMEMRDWRPGAKGRDDGLDAVAGCLLGQPVRLPLHAPLHAPSRRGPDWRPGVTPVIAGIDFDP